MTEPLFKASGKVSWFGGPADKGVSPSEGLAFIYQYSTAPYLFLDKQPPNTTGLARRLDPEVFYVACRWDYAKTPKSMLATSEQALVQAGDKKFLAWPSDWGPHTSTGRVADISPGLMGALGIKTDDSVEVTYPAPAEAEMEIAEGEAAVHAVMARERPPVPPLLAKLKERRAAKPKKAKPRKR
jgi:hypothetical protein